MYFISIDLDSSYWQLLADPEVRLRLAFFIFRGKKRWKLMPMLALNSASTFVAMMVELQIKWTKLAK